ncbi:MAG: WD40 repeat domain-containing protein, partial [Candidatus Krumholzibacteria bacterium]|nr:WD40 repeat domain-containing protein [Candidatus Krumholzibacteria bacterium]
LAILAAAAGIIALQQKNIAIEQRDESEARRLATVATANAAEQTDLAHLLALESLRVTETDEGWGALFSALSQPVFARSPLTGHQGKIGHVAFSPDGKQIASAGDDGTVRLWDVASSREVHQFTGHRHLDHPEIGIEVKAVAFSPDGRVMASGDSFGKIMLWEVKSRTQLGETMTGHTNAIKTLAFGSDGFSLASAGLDNKGKGDVRMWQVGSTGAQAGATLTGHDGEVRGVKFLGPTKLVSAGIGGTVRVWDTVAGAETGQAIPPQNGWGGALQIGPRGKVLAVANLDWSIHLWSLDTGERIGKPLTGHDGEVFAAAFSTDGKRLATASLDRTVRIWDLDSGEYRQIGEPLTGHKGEVSSVTFSPDNLWLATASLDGTVRLWDVSSGPSVGALLTDGESLPLVALSHDEARLASANNNGMVRVWDLATHSMIFEHQAHESATSVALSPDGSRLASGGFDGSIQLWSVNGGSLQPLGPPPAHQNRITSLAFSAGAGSKLASASADGVVRLWNVDLAQEIGATTTGHDGAVPGLVFSPNGSSLVSAGFDRTLRMWDMGLEPVGEAFTGHEGRVWDAVFNADGSQLTSVSSDGTVRRWYVSSGEQIGKPLIRSTEQWVGPAAFSPDGARLVTATSDGTLRLWDVASGQEIGVPLVGHGSEVTGMAFSQKAALLASASSDGSLRLWPAHDRWIERACKDVGRNLSLAEWKKFVDSNRPYQRQCARSPSGLDAPAAKDPEYESQFKKQK